MSKSKFPLKSEYSKLLLDPRWQKKRLEILNRDDFTCQYCSDGENTLHIHHKYYKYNQAPWEYEDESLITLCVNCHEEHSAQIKKSESRLLKAFAMQGFLSHQLDVISEALEKLPLPAYINEPCASEIAFAINSKDCRELFWKETISKIDKKKWGNNNA